MNSWQQYNDYINYILIPIALFLLFNGIDGLVKNYSPDNLENMKLIIVGFVAHFKYHFYIIFGALLITILAWINNKS